MIFCLWETGNRTIQENVNHHHLLGQEKGTTLPENLLYSFLFIFIFLLHLLGGLPVFGHFIVLLKYFCGLLEKRQGWEQ